jgi:hypothetical protein
MDVLYNGFPVQGLQGDTGVLYDILREDIEFVP